MTLDDLVNETLVQKNRRLRQAKCQHEEVYSSTVNGAATNSVCLDCGKSWRTAALSQEDGSH